MGELSKKYFRLVFVCVLFTSSCSNKVEEILNNQNNHIDTKELIHDNDELIPSSFEEIWIDKENKRLFAVIDTTFIFREEEMNNMILDYYSQLNEDTILFISFFKSKESATYKDELFDFYSGEDVSIGYFDWREFQYIGEYNDKSQTLKTYPSSNDHLKRKKIKINRVY